jgi:hypothetical protein
MGKGLGLDLVQKTLYARFRKGCDAKSSEQKVSESTPKKGVMDKVFYQLELSVWIWFRDADELVFPLYPLYGIRRNSRTKLRAFDCDRWHANDLTSCFPGKMGEGRCGKGAEADFYVAPSAL